MIRADQLAAKVPARGWQRLSCGPGSKGERLYDWALADAGDGRHLLIRRSVTSDELAYYLCWSPRHATLADLVRAAGARWAVEEAFQAAKNETALDHYQACKPIAWYRYVTLAMCAAPGWPSAAPVAGPRPERAPAAGPVTVTGPERGPPACGQLSPPRPHNRW